MKKSNRRFVKNDGIYIAEFTDGYRVAYAKDVERCFIGGGQNNFAYEAQWRRFKNCYPYNGFRAMRKAESQARSMDSVHHTKYGVRYLKFYHSFKDVIQAISKRL